MQFGELKFGELKLYVWTSTSLQKIYILDWSKKFTSQTRRKSAKFPTISIEFGHQMQKLQRFELDLKFCEAFFGTFGLIIWTWMFQMFSSNQLTINLHNQIKLIKFFYNLFLVTQFDMELRKKPF